MNILIDLRSHLICELLCDFLTKEQNKYQILITNARNISYNFKPDLILVDSNTVNQKLFSQWPEAKVLLIDTGLEKEDIVKLLISYEIKGVISTNTNLHLFKKAIEVVSKGQMWIDDSNVKALLMSKGVISKTGKIGSVSTREKQIIEHITQGLTNKEIASRLLLSEHTVKAHLSRIFGKFNVSNRSQLIVLFLNEKSKLSILNKEDHIEDSLRQDRRES